MHYFQEGCDVCHYDHCNFAICKYSIDKGKGYVVHGKIYCNKGCYAAEEYFKRNNGSPWREYDNKESFIRGLECTGQEAIANYLKDIF
jgi:hypothetical protein